MTQTPNSILAIVELLQSQLDVQAETISVLKKKNSEMQKQLKQVSKDCEQAQEVARRMNELYIKALRSK
jgi:predicted nucleic acid-binding protein